MQNTLQIKELHKILKNLEKTKKTYWNITPEIGLLLKEIIIHQKYKTVLEIGTSNGYSGIWMAIGLKETKGKLFTIESNKARYHLAKKNFQQSGLNKNIKQILGHAPENLPPTPRYFDMIFLDATKYEHINYLKALENRIKDQGIIITDNVISHKKALTPYLKTIKPNKSWTTYTFKIDHGIAISIKNNILPKNS